jgi:hypothetical protein
MRARRVPRRVRVIPRPGADHAEYRDYGAKYLNLSSKSQATMK